MLTKLYSLVGKHVLWIERETVTDRELQLVELLRPTDRGGEKDGGKWGGGGGGGGVMRAECWQEKDVFSRVNNRLGCSTNLIFLKWQIRTQMGSHCRIRHLDLCTLWARSCSQRRYKQLTSAHLLHFSHLSSRFTLKCFLNANMHVYAFHTSEWITL